MTALVFCGDDGTIGLAGLKPGGGMQEPLFEDSGWGVADLRFDHYMGGEFLWLRD
jgi:hypothetical protein